MPAPTRDAMSAYGLIEFLVIVGAVLLSAWTVLGRVAPGWRARLLGRWMPAAPKAGCGSGCNSCGSCDTPKATEQTIRFESRRKPQNG